MMKIGIITWFTYENYGTKLQAIALQEYLNNFGYKAELINFFPPEYEEPRDYRSLRKKISDRIKRYVCKYGQKKYKEEIFCRSNKFKKIIDENCILSSRIRTKEEYIRVCNEYDYLICGSDQIWNPQWIHPFYYAAFEEINTKKIAYAPSIGVDTINERYWETYKTYLKDFSAIAMREVTGQREIQKLYHNEVAQVFDPTLLLSSLQWDELLNIQNRPACKEYVCVYFLGDKSNHWKAVREFASCKGLEVKIIPQVGSSYIQKGEIVAGASVPDFVECIRNAKYVITDSFHAAVFSVIYRKEFYVIERFCAKSMLSQNSRIYDFLRILGLEHRIQEFGTSKIKTEDDCNYTDVINKIELEMKLSKEFLEKSLGVQNGM